MGQRFHQSKFFYKVIKDNPGNQYISDSSTFTGIQLLSKYKRLPNIQVVKGRNFVQKITEVDFIHKNADCYLLINIPENYGLTSVNFDKLHYTLIAENERKPRKICYVPVLKGFLKNNLCDISNGGKIYKINYDGACGR